MQNFSFRRNVCVLLLLLSGSFAFLACSSGRVQRLREPLRAFLFNESEAQQTKTRKLMLIGDSWAQFMTSNHTFDRLLEEYGYENYYCGSTALIGSKARQWGSRSGVATVRRLLRARPETKIVLITIGGNDFLELYRANQSPSTRERNWTKVAGHVRALLKGITEERPDVKVLIVGYTFINLVESLDSKLTDANSRYFRRLGSPTPEQVNGGLVEISAKIRDVTLEFDQAFYVQNFGLLQYLYGVAGADLAAGVVPYPGTLPSNYEPFPGGDPTLPGPAAAMFKLPNFSDSIHLSGEAYYYVGKNAMIQFIDPWLQELQQAEDA